jgi:hypothetical protein
VKRSLTISKKREDIYCRRGAARGLLLLLRKLCGLILKMVIVEGVTVDSRAGRLMKKAWGRTYLFG